MSKLSIIGQLQEVIGGGGGGIYPLAASNLS